MQLPVYVDEVKHDSYEYKLIKLQTKIILRSLFNLIYMFIILWLDSQ